MTDFRSFGLVLIASSAFLAGCPSKTTDPAPVGSVTAPAPVSAPAPKPSAEPAASKPSPTSKKQAGTVWYEVSKGGVELGTIELHLANKGVLRLIASTNEATELRNVWDKLNAGDARIAIDMHLPPENGKGRGDYGTMLAEPGDDLYKHAVEQELERLKFDVSEIPEFIEPKPPKSVYQLEISRSDEPVGVVTFGPGKPTVKATGGGSEASSLQNRLDYLKKQDSVRVKYHRPTDDGKSELVVIDAKPGDPDYANAVRLYLMLKNYYTAKHAYAVKVIEKP